MLPASHCMHQMIGKTSSKLSKMESVFEWGEKEKLWLCTSWRLLRYSSTHSIPQHWLEVNGLPQATVVYSENKNHQYTLNRWGWGVPNAVWTFQKMKTSLVPTAQVMPLIVHPIAKVAWKIATWKKAVKYNKHLFTPGLVLFLIFPRSHCRYQIRSPFLYFCLQKANPPSDASNFTTAASVCVAANDRPTVLTVVTERLNCITF